MRQSIGMFMEQILIGVAGIGFLLSVYALYVEIRYKKSKAIGYKPLCDINEKISCTKTFESKYGRIAFLPNPVYGILFYCLTIVCTIINQFNYVFIFSILAALGSIYLACLSFFKLRLYCIICAGIYIVNITLVIISYNLL